MFVIKENIYKAKNYKLYGKHILYNWDFLFELMEIFVLFVVQFHELQSYYLMILLSCNNKLPHSYTM